LAQWNNSSSNVPRFAANLSFSPIEPIKPTGGQKSASEPNPTSTTAAVLQPSKVDSVPEADFDWNTSGLVNPLDGKLIDKKLFSSHLVFCCPLSFLCS
jgi:hypothetical protein